MTDVHFYHLGRQNLLAVLPTLLERSGARGWRALVKLGDPSRMGALDDHLWSYSEDGFLPHGTDGDGDRAHHSVLLTAGDANPNGAAILFLVDRAVPPPDLSPFERVAILLDGRDEDAIAEARDLWRAFRGGGHDVTYWQQDGDGRWNRRG